MRSPADENGEHTPLACRFRRRAETLVWTSACVRRDAGHRTRDTVRSPDHATSPVWRDPRRQPGSDATEKLPGESRFHRNRPPLIQMDAAVKAEVEKLFGSR